MVAETKWSKNVQARAGDALHLPGDPSIALPLAAAVQGRDMQSRFGLESCLRGEASVSRVAAVAVVTSSACYAALQWPANAYLLLLTAVAAGIWLVGPLWAVLLTAASMIIAALSARLAAGPSLLPVIKDPAHVVLFIAIVVLIGAAVETLRGAGALAEEHATELASLNGRLEQEMEEVQALSEHLREANEALTVALEDAQQTAARASALQEVTAALSGASTVPDVAHAVLTRGLLAIHATCGCLIIVADQQALDVIADVGYADSDRVRQWYRRSDVHLPLADAIRERQAVWLRTATECRERFGHESAEEWPGPDMQAHLALPLLHGEDVVGGLTFDFARPVEVGGTNELFVGLLAQATGDALVRARRFDEEREGRQAAEIVSRTREEVLGVVAHDLRNPLNLLSTTAHLLVEPGLPPERRQAVYAINAKAVRRMSRLIGDLLDVVRLEAGRLSLHVGPCEIDRVLGETAEAFQARATEHAVTLALMPDASGAVVPADGERLMQVLDNLVGNALKFTPAGGTITLSSAAGDGWVRMAVSDTGPGISEEHRARLFERFWQARDTDHRGLGLGLAIARGIVEAHGGVLKVDSTLGSGSTFQLTLPRP
jgi:signal transduction histidine kinase